MVGVGSATISNDSTATRGSLARARAVRTLATRLRPGAVLALSVVAVVGCAGIFQWDRELIITGLVAGVVILMLNILLVAVAHWHRTNTQLDSSYSAAEDVVMMRSPSSSQRRRSPK